MLPRLYKETTFKKISLRVYIGSIDEKSPFGYTLKQWYIYFIFNDTVRFNKHAITSAMYDQLKLHHTTGWVFLFVFLVLRLKAFTLTTFMIIMITISTIPTPTTTHLKQSLCWSSSKGRWAEKDIYNYNWYFRSDQLLKNKQGQKTHGKHRVHEQQILA